VRRPRPELGYYVTEIGEKQGCHHYFFTSSCYTASYIISIFTHDQFCSQKTFPVQGQTTIQGGHMSEFNYFMTCRLYQEVSVYLALSYYSFRYRALNATVAQPKICPFEVNITIELKNITTPDNNVI
jgi:hypothetical protein